jgi:hypothetical protein
VIKVLRPLIGLLLAFIFIMTLAIPSFAIGNPTSVTIGDVYAFTNVSVTGDQLYFMRYDVDYAVTPVEDADTTWEMALYSSAGALVATRPLNYYPENIISIYLTPAQAITWGAAHQVKVRGMPAVFGVITEGVNMKTRTLAGGDYYSNTYLGGVMLTQAQILQTSWGIVLLSNGYLNATGKTAFLEAVPNLNLMEPDIFLTTSSGVVVPTPTWATNGTANATARQGNRLRGAINGTASIFGISSEGWGAFWLLGILYFVVAGVMYAVTRSPSWAMGGAFPVVLLGGWVGLGQGELLQGIMIIVLILGVLFALFFILERLG